MNKQLYLDKLKEIQLDSKDIIKAYNDISSLAMQCIDNINHNSNERNAYYFSMEFLMGRSFFNNLMELDVLEETKEILKEKGIDINAFEEIEDAALGNGGLGRLAACFLDSAANLNLPLHGYGIRFKYGLFKQKIENGLQVEINDDWQSFGDPWSIKTTDKYVVSFADRDVHAVAYDMPIFGKRVNRLRLFEAEDCPEICEYLYPNDSTFEGKVLRLKQEYFLSSLGVQDMIRNYVKNNGNDFSRFVKLNAAQLNDTHPVLAICELIRILTNEYNLSFSKAFNISRQVFSYTNHTILMEALECWPIETIEKVIPEIKVIIDKIVKRQKNELLGFDKRIINDTSIIQGNSYSMANLAVYVCRKVNGVAKIHTEILKESLFKSFNEVYPNKIVNKTNGITQRRWLQLCNNELSSLIDKTIGKEWREDISKLDKLNDDVDSILNDFIEVKNIKKKQLIEEIKKKENIDIDGDRIIFAQVKRLHEYKRQLLSCFMILELYYRLKDHSLKSITPCVFIFGAKAAPSYLRAKGIIKFINEIANLVNNDPETNSMLKVVFVSNYCVSYAEKIIPASDVSLQVSTAGLEASGTGNMKFMINGAVTCGTMDGANIEIVEKAGLENNYIFGATVDEIAQAKNDNYNPNNYLNNPYHKKALESLIDGTFSDDGLGYFKELYDSLTMGASWHKPDHYFVFLDLQSYVDSVLKILNDYNDRKAFAKKQLLNIANAYDFSSDRTIKEYAEEIWEIK